MSNDVTDLYQEVILEHVKHLRNLRGGGLIVKPGREVWAGAPGEAGGVD